MRLISNRLVIDHEFDRIACSSAYLAHSPIRPINSFQREGDVDEQLTAKVLKGLGKISLEEPGYDYHGLRQEDADCLIAQLAGDVDEFIDTALRQISPAEVDALMLELKGDIGEHIRTELNPGA